MWGKKREGNEANFAKHLLCAPELVMGVLGSLTHSIWDQSPWFRSKICHWLAVRPWTSHLAALALAYSSTNGVVNICHYQRAGVYWKAFLKGKWENISNVSLLVFQVMDLPRKRWPALISWSTIFGLINAVLPLLLYDVTGENSSPEVAQTRPCVPLPMCAYCLSLGQPLCPYQ